MPLVIKLLIVMIESIKRDILSNFFFVLTFSTMYAEVVRILIKNNKSAIRSGVSIGLNCSSVN